MKVSLHTITVLMVAVACVTSAVIYLTPLKWVTVLTPHTIDIDARTFYADYQANPEAYLFLDVRNESVYNTAHARGSLSQPIGTFFDGHRFLPKAGKKIVLICSSGRLAGVAYGYLEHEGFLNLRRIDGGLQNWIVSGLPVDGSNPSAPVPVVD
jgi:phage shock protein E